MSFFDVPVNVPVNVPDGESGDWKVSTFEVTEEGALFHNLHESINPHRGVRHIVPGFYKQLTRRGEIIMSDTPAEIRDLIPFVCMAVGNILVTGLGLGVMVSALAARKQVTGITVIEKSPDVVKLVAPSYRQRGRIRIIRADAFTWKVPEGVKFSFAWHDIWDTISRDNLGEMYRLKRKYAPFCRRQECWCHELCENM
jgi:hypothetical protein